MSELFGKFFLSDFFKLENMTSVENSTESSILIPDLSAKEQDQRDRCIAGLIILAVN